MILLISGHVASTPYRAKNNFENLIDVSFFNESNSMQYILQLIII